VYVVNAVLSYLCSVYTHENSLWTYIRQYATAHHLGDVLFLSFPSGED
jgi:hypothetical protein